MADRETDLRKLAQEVDQLRRELDAERLAFDQVRVWFQGMLERCDTLARAVEIALSPAAAPTATAPPRPITKAEPTPEVAGIALPPMPVTMASEAPTTTLEPAEAPAASVAAREEAPAEPAKPVAALLHEIAAPQTPARPPSPIAPPRPSPAPETAAAPPAPKPPRDIEAAIGSYWLSRIGAVSLLVGFVFLASYIAPRLLPWHRVAMSYATALVLTAVGFWTERNFPKYSRPVLSTGLTLAFFTSFAAYYIEPMSCLSEPVSATLMLVMAALVVATAALLQSQLLAMLALAMGLWCAGWATGVGGGTFTPIMLFFLALMPMLLFVLFRWANLLALAVPGVYLCHLWWMIRVPDTDWSPTAKLLTQIIFLTSYFAPFLAADLRERLGPARDEERYAWQPLLPVGPSVLIARFLNPMLYFLIVTFAFFAINMVEFLEYFYWPLGAVLAGVGALGWLVKREWRRGDDVLFIMASGVLTLGIANYFDAMSLSNALALEGLVLYAIRRSTGRGVFRYLSAAHYTIAFFHFNLVTFDQLGGVDASNWRAFWSGLPAAAFAMAPAFLDPLWRRGPDEAEPASRLGLTETQIGHFRAFLASVLLLRLFHETIRPDVAFGLWVLLIPAVCAAALYWRTAFPLWTLGGTFAAWAHAYFFTQLQRVQAGEPWWMYPGAIALTLMVLALGVFIEKATKGRIYEVREGEDNSLWTLLTSAALILVVADVTALLELRTSDLHRFPLAAVFMLGLILGSVYSRYVFPSLAGAFLVTAEAAFLIQRFVTLPPGTPLAGLILWTLGAAAVAALAARMLSAEARSLLRRAYNDLRLGPILPVLVMVGVLAGLIAAIIGMRAAYDATSRSALLATALAPLALGFFVERLTRYELRRTGEAVQEFKISWALLGLTLAGLTATHITLILIERVGAVQQFPAAMAVALALAAAALLTRTLFPLTAGLLLLGINAVVLLLEMGGGKPAAPYFLHWTIAGAVLFVLFERLYVQWLRRAWPELAASGWAELEFVGPGNRTWFQYVSMGLIGLVILLLLAAIHVAPPTYHRYETLGTTLVAAAFFALGLALRSGRYRRFGLAVFVLGLARIYLHDIWELENPYRFIAIIGLSSVVLFVSYLYTRFRQQFQRWV